MRATILMGLTLAAAATALPMTAARADTIYKGSGGSNPLPLAGVHVKGISGGKVQYVTTTGNAREADLDDVPQMTIDGQAAFNDAEAAYAARNSDAARDGYAAVLRGGGGADWLKVRAARRLAGLARASHRYDLQVAAYAELVKTDAPSAADAKPAVPSANDPTLDAAQQALSRGMASIPTRDRGPLLGVQLDIARAKGDKAAVTTTIQQLVATGAATPAQQALLKLAQANVALDNDRWGEAQATVQQNKALFTDPVDQVDALWILAAAGGAQLKSTPSPDAIKDAALAYMRVVAFGDRLPDRPHVGPAMLRAAQLAAMAGDAKGAATLYQKLSTDKAFAGTPAAAAARQALKGR